MQNEKNYRPVHIEFEVVHDGSSVPEQLGEFDSVEKVHRFMNQFFMSNQALTVARFMDNFEKSEIRKKYNDILENILPELEQKIRDANQVFLEAKKALADVTDMSASYMTETKQLAYEVKRGTREIRLDDQFTWKLPYKGKFYFYTYIDKAIRLVKISEMTDSQKNELFSQGKINEDIFDTGSIKDVDSLPEKDAEPIQETTAESFADDNAAAPAQDDNATKDAPKKSKDKKQDEQAAS